MGTSTGRDLHIDQNLTQIAINYKWAGMVADAIAPIVNVSKESDLYPVFNRGEIMSLESTQRARGAEARKVTRSVSSNGYQVKNYALGMDVFLEDRVNIDAAYEAEMFGGAAQYVTQKLQMDWDYRILQAVGSASNVSTGFLTGSAWNAATNAGDPISAIFQTIEQLQSRTAQRPNSIVMGWKAWRFMSRNTNVRNFLSGTNNGGGLITRQQMASLFEVDRFLVSEAFYNTANENKAESLVSPFADKVLVYYAPPNPSREVPSFMYSFRWSAPGLPNFVAERHPYDTRKKIETVECGYYQDEKITGSEYGALLLGVGSAQANGLV